MYCQVIRHVSWYTKLANFVGKDSIILRSQIVSINYDLKMLTLIRKDEH